jgi:MarR family transcriptional regulator, transcriptional regulator for hemolysin
MAPPNDAVPLILTEWRDTDPADRPSAAALQPGIGYRLHAVARLIRRRFERSAREAGLPITRLQAGVLLYVARNPGVSQTAAATELDIEPIALVRMLDRLHEEGLVERRPHPTDRRVRTLWLTPLAWPVVDRILAINLVVREEACAGLSPTARQALMDALDHIKNNLAADEAAGDQEPHEPER